MRQAILALMVACGSITAASAQVSVGVGVSLPGVSIGINVPSYPQLVRVPSYPVYYAPGMDANFFFYDGMYWVYQSDNWYSSSWYNGPWLMVSPAFVPVYVLRVPVRYYRAPPTYFHGWRPDGPPRWGDHWGRGWEQQHRGWDRWNRSAVPAPAPLPVYQRQYSGNRYPPVEQQRALQSQNYRYQPRDAVVRQHFEQAAPPRPDRQPHGQQPVPQIAPRAEAPPPHGGPAAARQAPQGRAHDDNRPVPAPMDRAPQGRPAPPQVVPQAVQMRPESPAARAPVDRGPAPGAQAPHERPGRGQGQGQEREHGRGEGGRGQDKKE